MSRINTEKYDNDNGKGAFEHVLAVLREKKATANKIQ